MTIENLDKMAVIKWRLGDYCNFRCPYCIRREFIQDASISDLTDAVPYVNKIVEELRQNTGKKVKVDLIGGEVTLYPKLDELIRGIDADKVNITTNGDRTDVLMGLKSKKRISLCISLHPSQVKETSVNEWFENKVRPLIGQFAYLQCETVAVYEADWIQDFKNCMIRNEVDYKVEENLLDSRCKGRSCSSIRPKPRYRVTFNEDRVEYFNTRNEFLKKEGWKGKCVITNGHLCSRNFDYVYIEKDKVFHCHKEPELLKDFKLEPDFHPCYRDTGELKDGKLKKATCTLCGNISIKEKEECSETSIQQQEQ